jgi:hypothetical protein
MSNGVSALKKLKKSPKTTEDAATVKTEAPVKTDVPAAALAATNGGEKTKKGSGLIPRTKDPEKAKLEADTQAAITELLKASKDGLMATDLRLKLWPTLAEDEVKETERFIRQQCRAMGCDSVPIEGSRKVKYTLPKK